MIAPYYDQEGCTIYLGDCLDIMPTLEANSIDSIVTDPPYGLSFMGKDWDHGVPGVPFWIEALRVAKPGAFMLAFGGTRTHHRLMVAIEDAGWEIRDCVMWIYGSGFPKSHDVSKAIDKAAGVERRVIGDNPNNRPNCAGKLTRSMAAPITVQPITASATDAARQWEGWGTALKPAWEPIIVARKPIEGTVANNVLKWGTGGINIDGCRVEYGDEKIDFTKVQDGNIYGGNEIYGKAKQKEVTKLFKEKGRFPANLIHDGSDEVVGLFPNTKSGSGDKGGRNTTAFFGSGSNYHAIYNGDSGSAARFFYCPKASKQDRDEGCEGIEKKQYSHDGRKTPIENAYQRNDSKSRNNHPTVKPTPLMRYLCRLVTPPNGIILDPFAGSGSTGKAAILEGFKFIGIELEMESVEIAVKRLPKKGLPL